MNDAPTPETQPLDDLVAPSRSNGAQTSLAGPVEETREQLVREKEITAEVGRIISSSFDIDRVYERFAEEVRKLIPFDRIVIMTGPDEQDTMTNQYVYGVEVPGRKKGDTFNINGAIPGEVVRTAAPLVIQGEDVAELARRVPRVVPFQEAGLKSMIATPLISNDRVIGAMSLRSREPDAYTPHDLALIKGVGDQIAGAVANAQLFNERVEMESGLRRSEEEARRLALETRTLAEIGRIISSSLDVNQVYERFADQVRTLIPFSQLQITVIDGDRETDTVAFSKGLFDTASGFGESTPLDGSLTGKMASSYAGIIVQGFRPDEVESLYPCLVPSANSGISSWLAVPLVARGEAVGALFFNSTRPMAFTKGHLDIAERVGNQIAGAVANAQLYAERARAVRQIAVVGEIAQIITSNLDIDEVYDQFAASVKSLIDFDRMGVNVINDGDLAMTVAKISPAASVFKEGVTVPLEGTQTGQAAKTRRTVLIGDLAEDTIFYASPDFVKAGLRTLCTVPMISKGRVVATLSMAHRHPHAFSAQDQTILERLATQIAPAIENARLYEEARFRAEELDVLSEIARIITSTLDLEEVYQQFAEAVKRLVDFDRASIDTIDHDAGTIKIAYLSRRTGSVLNQGETVRLEGTVSELASTTRRTQVVDDFAEDTRFWAANASGDGLRSMISMPLISNDRVIGTFNLMAQAPHSYGAWHREVLERLASQIAPAVENALLFEELKASRDRMGALSAQLVDAQESERRYLARELHNEIGQVLTGLRLTLETNSPRSGGVSGESLIMAQSLIEDLLQRVREMSLDLRPPMLDDMGLLPALMWYIDRYTSQTNIRVKFEHWGIEGRFKQDVETATFRIIQEALTNVARHADVREVAVEVKARGSRLAVGVEDNGTGFDPESKMRDMNAAGLAGMTERADMLGGHLTLRSTPGGGTRLDVELPTGRRRARRTRK